MIITGNLISLVWALLIGFAQLVGFTTEFSNAKAATQGVLYYVDGASGSDSNPGSAALPWKTIQKAANTMSAGDTVYVLAGNYDQLVLVSRSGAYGQPIVYQAQGAVVTRGFQINASYITVKGFELTNPINASTSKGIFVKGSNCIIEDNTIHNTARDGIVVFATASNPTASQNCIIRNNRIYRVEMVGITVNGRNHLIENNEIWETLQYGPHWPNAPSYVDADGIRFFGSGHIFRGNYIHDIHFSAENIDPHIDCFQTWSGGDYEVASYILFEKNTCYLDTHPPKEDMQGFMLEGGAHHLTIRNNIIRAFRGINTNRVSNLMIVNNLLLGSTTAVANNSRPLAFYSGYNTNVVFQNNIIYDYYANIIVSGNAISGGHNLVYRSDGIFPNTDSAYNFPSDLWGINPLFINPATNDYHLSDLSPAVDAGIHLGSLVMDDFEGNFRPKGVGYDIGIFEYSPFEGSNKTWLPIIIR